MTLGTPPRQAAKRSYLLIPALLLASSHVAADSYSCRAQKVAGLTYEKGQWVVADFKPTGSYRIEQTQDSNYSVYNSSSRDWPLAICNEGFTSTGVLHCEGLSVSLSFNRNNLRMTRAYTYGYWTKGLNLPGSSDAEATPFIEISNCKSDA